jgi:mannose-6-phosphate isomerase-like protein (cupin superfamily)
MKLFKLGSKDGNNGSEPFYFKEIKGLDKLNVLTSYVIGESPEYQNDMAKLLMVLDGKLNLRTNDKNMRVDPGDVILIQSGERFRLNAKKGAKLLQLNYEQKSNNPDSIMDFVYKRHSTQEFSERVVSKKDIYHILKVGMYAPSAANRQPWKFIVISDPEMKRKVREAAEEVEKRYYKKIEKTKLYQDLKEMGLSWKKPFLEMAPFLICVFSNPEQPYYKESIWLAIGWMLLAAEEMGLATLTYTPSDVTFLVMLKKLNLYNPEKVFMK